MNEDYDDIEEYDDYDEQDERVKTILGTKNLDVTKKALQTYLKHIKSYIEEPCQLTGIEDFDWEEYYVIGPGSKKEYQELKKTRPSYRDKFLLKEIESEIRKRLSFPMARLTPVPPDPRLGSC